MGTCSSGDPALWVGTDLDHFTSEPPHVFADDVVISGRCYRLLDPAYYAWLRHKMAVAKRAADAGRLARAPFEVFRRRFNEVHDWALAHLGEPALLVAVEALDPATYEPPRGDDDGFADVFTGSSPSSPDGGRGGHAHPASGSWPFAEPVSPDAVAKVDAIRDEAVAKRWSEAALYQNRARIAFPCGGDWGLVCFLSGDSTIASVSREAITIEHARGSTLRFSNPDVEQPWRRRVGVGAA